MKDKFDNLWEKMVDENGDLIEERPVGEVIPSGHTFIVTVVRKEEGVSSHFGMGSDFEYMVDGERTPGLVLRVGGVYHFDVNTEEPKVDGEGHPLYIATEAIGGPLAPMRLKFGSDNDLIEKGIMTFAPGDDHMHKMLFYTCGIHEWMGGSIYLVPSSLGREGKSTHVR